MAWTQKISLGLCLFLIAGCTDIKKAVGIHKAPPKDFSVDPYPKGLEVPPEFGQLPTKNTENKGPSVQKKSKAGGATAAEKELMSRLSRKEGAR